MKIATTQKLVLAIIFAALFGCSKSGELTNSSAERAIKKAFKGDFEVKVVRIHEVPMYNAAEAQAPLTNFHWAENPQSPSAVYSGPATAAFEHSNSGWVLKNLSFENGRKSFDVDQPL